MIDDRAGRAARPAPAVSVPERAGRLHDAGAGSRVARQTLQEREQDQPHCHISGLEDESASVGYRLSGQTRRMRSP